MRRLAAIALFAALALFAPVALPARAQGCAQCKDNLAGTPLETQLAYRHAIELLALSGLAAVTGGLFLLRRYR